MTSAAPLYIDVADGPVDGAARWLTTSDGVRIRVAHWGAGAPHGTVLLFPGRTEYVEKYGRAAADLLRRGYATVTVDWRGQGIAGRVHANPALGHVTSFADYQHDVAAMVAHARDLDLPRPWYLLAHSMGGCIGLRSLIEGLPVKAAVFSAPMWGIRMAAALRPVAWGLSSVSRPLRFSHVLAPGQQTETYVLRTGYARNSLTSDREMFDYMRGQVRAHPDLALGGPTLNWLNESLREMRALARKPSPGVPVLTFLGTDEGIVDPTRIRQRMAGWHGAAFEVLTGARHEVMMEGAVVRTRIFDRVARLFAAHR